MLRALRRLAVVPAVVLGVALGVAPGSAPGFRGRAASAPAAGVKTIVVVRHAEAETGTPGNDPPLTDPGKARAAELARVLGDLQVRAIYCTRYLRSRLTAEPLARRAGNPLTVIDDVGATLQALKAEPWGSTEVVVGHSNTVPQLVEGLTGRPFADKEKVAHDRIWVVTLTQGGAVSILRLHYGAAVD
jgi:broad specificity phosphatase PhoE